jgi:hypothetical protein
VVLSKGNNIQNKTHYLTIFVQNARNLVSVMYFVINITKKYVHHSVGVVPTKIVNKKSISI